jgi:hypothetical protein
MWMNLLLVGKWLKTVRAMRPLLGLPTMVLPLQNDWCSSLSFWDATFLAVAFPWRLQFVIRSDAHNRAKIRPWQAKDQLT